MILRSDYEDADLPGALHNSEDDSQPRFIEFRAKIEISGLNWSCFTMIILYNDNIEFN